MTSGSRVARSPAEINVATSSSKSYPSVRVVSMTVTSAIGYVFTGWSGRCCTVFFFQAEDGIRDYKVTGVQTCALPIWRSHRQGRCGRVARRHWLLDHRLQDRPLDALHRERFARVPPRTAEPVRSGRAARRSEEHTSELQSPCNLVCRLLLEKKNTHTYDNITAMYSRKRTPRNLPTRTQQTSADVLEPRDKPLPRRGRQTNHRDPQHYYLPGC